MIKYLYFKQNNSYGGFILNENIGYHTVFALDFDVTVNDYYNNKSLMEYFETIKFDPLDYAGADCSTCGGRWDYCEVFDSLDEVLEACKNKYTVIHYLNDNKKEFYNKSKEAIEQFMTNERITEWINSCINRNQRRYS